MENGTALVHRQKKTPVIIAVGDFASGVTSWAFRLREAMAENSKYTVLLMNCTDTGKRIGAYDLHAPTWSRARELLAGLGEAVVIPNFVWDLFPLCAALNQTGQQLHCVGFCRADSAEEYYDPLCWYAPVVSRFATVSPACTRTLARHLAIEAAAIHTLPTGVWVPATHQRDYHTAPLRIAYGGRIVQAQKRVMDFVPLVAKLYDHGVDFRFDIAGSGRQAGELERALSKVDHEKRVRLVPRVPPEAMPSFWAAHDVFVQTSAFEGTSNSMLESMAQGTVPVVTRTASGVEGIVEDGRNGFLVPPGDTAAMAQGLARLAREPETLARMGRAAYETTRPFAMECYVEKFIPLLDEAMAAPPGTWPEGHPETPPRPFPGVRLERQWAGAAQKNRLVLLFPSPLRGGAEDYTRTIAAGAVKEGYEVHGAFSGRTALQSLAEDYVRAGAAYHALEICDVGPKSDQAPAYKRFTRTVRFLRRHRPVVALYQLCGIQYGFLSLLGCAVAGVPTLVVFQLVRADIRFSTARRMIYRWMRARGQRYVAVSKANQGLLAHAFRIPREAIRVIPNGVDLGRFAAAPDARTAARATLRDALGLPHDTTVCLTVGRLSHQKGHDVLVPAIPHILARHPGTHFVWAGEGPQEAELRAMLETYGVAQNVSLLGRRDDMPQLLHASDLMVHPARFEGQPFSVLEAMAAGLPVVSADASGIGEAITHGEHGLLSRTDDIAALRDAVIETLDDPDSAAQRATAARARVEAFSEATMVQETLAALETLRERS